MKSSLTLTLRFTALNSLLEKHNRTNLSENNSRQISQGESLSHLPHFWILLFSKRGACSRWQRECFLIKRKAPLDVLGLVTAKYECAPVFVERFRWEADRNVLRSYEVRTVEWRAVVYKTQSLQFAALSRFWYFACLFAHPSFHLVFWQPKLTSNKRWMASLSRCIYCTEKLKQINSHGQCFFTHELPLQTYLPT